MKKGVRIRRAHDWRKSNDLINNFLIIFSMGSSTTPVTKEK